MNIVIDTNIIASSVFFGGAPLKLMERLFSDSFSAFVSPDIINEYFETYDKLHKKYSDRGNPELLNKIINKTNVIIPNREIHICRDPDDDKFISCALSAKCLYIVSGDRDLLSIGNYEDVEIVTVADFLERLG